jgi:hypothetical protein
VNSSAGYQGDKSSNKNKDASPNPPLARKAHIFAHGALTEGGRLSTVDLLVLTSLDQLLFTLQTLLTLFYKTSYLNKESNRTEPSPPISVPCFWQYLPFHKQVISQQSRCSTTTENNELVC